MNAVIPHSIEDLSRGIGLYVIARCHHYNPDRRDEDTNEISLWSAKDIQDLGNGEVANTADYAAQDPNSGCERVLCKGGRDIGKKGSCST